MFRIHAAVAVLLIGSAASAECQKPAAGTSAAELRGVVLDDQGEPLPGARVELVGVGRQARADAAGAFGFSNLRPGRVAVRLTLLGFAPRDTAVIVAEGDTLRLRVSLVRAAVRTEAVHVTATVGAVDPLAIPQSTASLGGRELERAVGATLGATLSGQPGVGVRYQGPATSAPIIRGLSGDRVLVLQDGVRAGDLASSAPDHGITIDPSSAQRIEIVRGPAALLYGNNAVGGVINVISDDIPSAVPTRATTSATAVVESAAAGGTLAGDLQLPLGTSTALSFRVGGRSHEAVRLGSGWETARLDNTSYRNANALLGVARHGERGSVGAAVRTFGFEYGLPVPPSAGGSGVTLDGSRHELVTRADRAFDGLVERVRFDGGAQWYTHDERFADGSLGTRLALRTQHAQVVARAAPGDRSTAGAVGVSMLARQNGVTGDQALTPTTRSSSWGAFAYHELALDDRAGAPAEERVRLPLGIRLDRHAIRSDESQRFGAGRERDFTGLSGSVGLAVPVARRVTAAATLARAVRSPTAEELFSQAGHTGTGAFEIGDPSLEAEVNTGGEVVLRAHRERTTVQLGAFVNRLDGYIGLYPAGRDTVVSDGAGGTKSLPLFIVSQRRATMRGVEWSVERAMTERVVVAASGDLLRARDADGGALPFLPAGRLVGEARYEDRRWSAGGAVRHSLAQRPVPDGELRVPAYTLADLHAGARIIRGQQVHSITLRVENAFDVLYRDAASRIKDYAPNPGRNVVLVYRVGF